MFAQPFVLQTGIWLISELVVHGRIPVVVPTAGTRPFTRNARFS